MRLRSQCDDARSQGSARRKRYDERAEPENREKLPFFAGIERVRFRRAVYAGDVVEIEARVKRLRSRMGQLSGFARVNGVVVLDGTMTFALGSREV